MMTMMTTSVMMKIITVVDVSSFMIFVTGLLGDTVLNGSFLRRVPGDFHRDDVCSWAASCGSHYHLHLHSGLLGIRMNVPVSLLGGLFNGNANFPLPP